MRLQELVARLAGVALFALAGCQLYFAPPDAAIGCECDGGTESCPFEPPDGYCWDSTASCSYGGDACGLGQETCRCDRGSWECTGPAIEGVDAGQQMCGVMEAERVPEHSDWTLSCGQLDHGYESLTSYVPNATLSFGFIGTSLDVYYEKGPDLGSFTVTIDTAPPVVVNANQPGSVTFQNVTAIASGLPYEPHTATITCTSLFCDLDYFNVNCD